MFLVILKCYHNRPLKMYLKTSCYVCNPNMLLIVLCGVSLFIPLPFHTKHDVLFVIWTLWCQVIKDIIASQNYPKSQQNVNLKVFAVSTCSVSTHPGLARPTSLPALSVSTHPGLARPTSLPSLSCSISTHPGLARPTYLPPRSCSVSTQPGLARPTSLPALSVSTHPGLARPTSLPSLSCSISTHPGLARPTSLPALSVSTHLD